jgi:hydroxypyruvate reductase
VDRGRRQQVEQRGDAAVIIGGRGEAMVGAAREAAGRGYHAIKVEEPVVGEARLAGASLVQSAQRARAASDRPCCVIASGETTVTVRGSGRGGRNQELALAVAPLLAAAGRPMLLASVGTDGIDGPTDAAGAIVDSTTVSRVLAAGADPAAALDRNDAYSIFSLLQDLVFTGPTGTNVGDLQVVLVP